MPLSTSFAGLSARALGWASSHLAKIYDNFARITSGSLGTATSGQVWIALTGVWYANSGVAQTSTSPSSYPNAAILVATNASVSVASPSPGAGVMVWETDSGDWWGAATYVTETSTDTYGCVSSSCCTGSNTCVSNSCCSTSTTCYGSSCCTGSNTCVSNACCSCGTCSTGVLSTGPSGGCLCTSGGHIVGGACISNSCCTGSNTCVSNSCCTSSTTCIASTCCTGSNTCVSNSCCSTYIAYTTYVWNSFMTILKSVASAITTIGTTPSLGSQSNTSGSYPGAVVNSLSVTTLGNTITAKAYSDTGFSSLLATLSETNSAPSGTGVGILLTPSPGYQGLTVGPFSAT